MDHNYKHPKRGRPRRQDWRMGPVLADEVPGTPLIAKVTFSNQRLRGTYLGLDEAGRYRFSVVTGEDALAWPHQVEYWRPIDNAFQEGDYVVLRGVPEAEWRGVVTQVHDEQVTVDASPDEHPELHQADALELAVARTRPTRRFKPGPVASDTTTEAINQASYDRREEVPPEWAR